MTCLDHELCLLHNNCVHTGGNARSSAGGASDPAAVVVPVAPSRAGSGLLTSRHGSAALASRHGAPSLSHLSHSSAGSHSRQVGPQQDGRVGNGTDGAVEAVEVGAAGGRPEVGVVPCIGRASGSVHGGGEWRAREGSAHGGGDRSVRGGSVHGGRDGSVRGGSAFATAARQSASSGSGRGGAAGGGGAGAAGGVGDGDVARELEVAAGAMAAMRQARCVRMTD